MPRSPRSRQLRQQFSQAGHLDCVIVLQNSEGKKCFAVFCTRWIQVWQMNPVALQFAQHIVDRAHFVQVDDL